MLTRTSRHLLTISMLLLLACGGGEEAQKNDARAKTDDGGDAADADADGDDGDGSGDGSAADPAAAAALWVNTVKPALEKQCATCHAEPRFVVPNRGPLTIFNYDKVKLMMADGTSSTSNKFINKPLGLDSHGGGVQCTVEEAPCKDIIQLRKLEFGGDGGSGDADGGDGELPGDADPNSSGITSMSTGGRLIGWAVDKANLTQKVSVKVVIGGKLGAGGTVAATTTADKLGEDGNHPGDHSFFVQIPASYRDGTNKELYVYDGNDELLNETATTYLGYSPTPAGRTFFNNNVEPAIRNGACNPCHAQNVTQDALHTWAYNAMAAEGPIEGGDASNNLAVKKASGQISHNGNNACGGATNGACAQFTAWWPIIFPDPPSN